MQSDGGIPGAEAAPATRALTDLISRRAITMAFQPIVDLHTGEILGYEALARPHGDTAFSNPGELFAAAEQSGHLPELEALARRLALDEASTWPASLLLFVNNSPPTFMDEGLGDTIQAELKCYDELQPRRLVLEVTEHAAYLGTGNPAARAIDLRERGFHIAIDDVGAGMNGLNQITLLRPHWIKLDRQLIADIDFDPIKQNLIRFFVHFARLSDMNVIAEGIERHAELATLIRLGVTHGQGYYLARPGEGGAPIDDETLATIAALNIDADRLRFQDVGAIRVESLASPVATCAQDVSVEDALLRLRLHTRSQGVAVLDGRRFAGWIERERLDALAASGSGHTRLADADVTDCPRVGADATLAEALEVMASHLDQSRVAPLAVISKGRVAGVVMLPQLLMAAAESHRRSPARMASLTGLPTRVQADQWVSRCIQAGDPSSVAIVDLRDFDAYNIAYGFEMGDALLMHLVGLLQRQFVDGEHPRGNFVAHLGEDRFLVCCRGDALVALSDLVDQFDDFKGQFFSAMDRAAGTFTCTDPSGRRRTYATTSLRVVLIPHAYQRARTPRELYRLAAEIRMRGRDSVGPGATGKVMVDARVGTVARRESA